MTPPFKEKSHFLEKVVLLARRSALKRNKIARSFGGEGNRSVCSLEQEGNRIDRRCQGKGRGSVYPLTWINWDSFPLVTWKDFFDGGIQYPFPSPDIYDQSYSLPVLNYEQSCSSPPKLRAILLLFPADLQKRSATFTISAYV